VRRDDALLPSFARPPLVEVAIGVGFDKLHKLQAPHLGLWWQKLGQADFPECESKPPLQPPAGPGPQTLEVSNVPPLPRMWFVGSDGEWLNQVQPDRFLLNWRKPPDKDYPRFPKVERRFRELWDKWLQFLADRELGAVERAQYQLTYVNHVLFDDVLKRSEDVHYVLPHLAWSAEDKVVLASQETTRWEGVFQPPDFRGRLTVQAFTGRSAVHGNQPTLVIQMIAAGEDDEVTAAEWFQDARSVIVRGFSELTSELYQSEKWGRDDGDSTA
jgi:uncharacterized protein (TIGR04255 family)